MKRLSIIKCREDVRQGLAVLREGRPLYAFDTETTGLSSKKDKILTFSAKRLTLDGDGAIRTAEEFEVWLKNGPVPPEASAVNGITDDMLKDGLSEDEGMKSIRAFLGEDPFLVSYNGKNFDVRFMNEAYLRAFGEPFRSSGHIDVLQMARETLDIDRYRLASVAHELGADRGVDFHHSMDDVEATVRVFRMILPYYTKERAEARDARGTACTYVKVAGARYYEHPLNHRVKRVYIYTFPGSGQKTWYDIYRSEWRTEREDLDLEDIRRQVLRRYAARDEKELCEKLKSM